MAIKLENKPNVIAPGGAYPYGDIKDNPGDGSGTPVNRIVYADIHQFFAKMMDVAGQTYNGLAENATNGFEYITGMIKFIRLVVASETDAGCAEIATQAETNTGTDDARLVTPLKLKNAKTVMGVDGSAGLRSKVVAIGAWNMDSTAILNVAHGLTLSKIRSVSAMIIDDAGTTMVPLDIADISTGAKQGTIGSIDATNVQLARLVSGTFDSANYDSTGASRGNLVIVYEP